MQQVYAKKCNPHEIQAYNELHPFQFLYLKQDHNNTFEDDLFHTQTSY